MDVRLTPELQQVREMCRDFAQRELTPNARRWDEEHHFPAEAIRQLGELGLMGIAVPTDFGGKPDRDDRERRAVGKVQPLNPQHFAAALDLEPLCDLGARRFERELEHTPFGDRSGCFERGFDRRDPPERLAHGVERSEPAAPPPTRDEPVRPQRLERSAHGDSTHAVGGSEIGLTGQCAAGCEVTVGELGSQAIGDIEVTHRLVL